VLPALAVAVVLVAAWSDHRHGRIPNALTLPALAAGLVLGSPAGALVSAGLPLLLFGRGKVGGGDVKLFAALGALLGVRLGLTVEALALLGALAMGHRRLGPWVALATTAILAFG